MMEIIRLRFRVLGYSVVEKITTQNAGFPVLDGAPGKLGTRGSAPSSTPQTLCPKNRKLPDARFSHLCQRDANWT